MIYLALLRGINVGGNNKVPMSDLKEVFMALGCENVRTYINSGNVLFDDKRKPAKLHAVIEDALLAKFGFAVKTLVIDKPTLGRVARALPADWRNDTTMRCDVIFLWNEKNTPGILEQLPINTEVDTVKYVDGALLWSAPRNQVTKSGLHKVIGTDLYKKMTIRNCNTVRKLAQLAE